MTTGLSSFHPGHHKQKHLSSVQHFIVFEDVVNVYHCVQDNQYIDSTPFTLKHLVNGYYFTFELFIHSTNTYWVHLLIRPYLECPHHRILDPKAKRDLFQFSQLEVGETETQKVLRLMQDQLYQTKTSSQWQSNLIFYLKSLSHILIWLPIVA